MAFSTKTVVFGVRQWAIVVLLVMSWGLAVWARILWNGDVYGLDYRLFHPDGICYGAVAFDFAGTGIEGREQLAGAYAAQDTPIGGLGPDIDDASTCSSVRTRVLYPLLSAPLVNALGYYGLLVVPAISWLIAVLTPAVLLLRRGFTLAPTIAGLLVIASSSIGRWSVANVVDALLMGIMALSLLVLPIFEHKAKWWRLGLFALLILLGSLTRQSWPTWIALVTTPWVAYAMMHRSKGIRGSIGWANPWTGFAIVGVGTALASWQLIGATLGSQKIGLVASRLKDAVAATEVPGSDRWMNLWEEAWMLAELATAAVVVEIGQLVVLDKALLIAFGLAFFGVWKHRRWPASYAFLGVLLVAVTLTALNATQGINFRFAMAVVPWVVLLGGSWSQPAGESGARERETSGS